MSDEEGAENVILGLNRMKKIVGDNNVVLCLELLNSKVNHKDYMADHTAWGVAVMKESKFPPCEAPLRHLSHANHGRRFDCNHPGQHSMAGTLSGGVPGRHELNISRRCNGTE